MSQKWDILLAYKKYKKIKKYVSCFLNCEIYSYAIIKYTTFEKYILVYKIK